ncbi:copper resistance protein CopC [Leifsonia soli]|uniref:CopC domain-containing protein n=1 Tax=Leifsonia soli TaxID=582665 RepID=A0A852T086_9MICO|nr:hypothetical protein [Leifsonia soli]
MLIFLSPAQRASAHSPLESSTPEAGASIATMPAQIDLTFGAAVQESGATVVLADEHGGDWTAGAAVVEHGTVVSATVKPDAPDGRYEIRWSVVSFDGAPMSGVLRFTLGTAVADTNPLDTVLTATDASWALVGAFVVVGVPLVYMAYGLITVYGRHEKKAAIGQKEIHHE